MIFTTSLIFGSHIHVVCCPKWDKTSRKCIFYKIFIALVVSLKLSSGIVCTLFLRIICKVDRLVQLNYKDTIYSFS